MQKVHDILRSRKHPGVLVAYVQRGNSEEGFVYEMYCPYCGRQIGYVDDRNDAETHVLHQAMRLVTGRHIEHCQFAGSATLAVEKATGPIPGAEKLPTIH
jgi:hypothetical protein